jgi:hypothetical protein
MLGGLVSSVLFFEGVIYRGCRNVTRMDLLQLSAHLFATQPGLNFEIEGYKNELLTLAYDLGERLLPAFYTKTGIPYSRVGPT